MNQVLDNSAVVGSFVPEHDDGDTFVYTEMLDRSKKTGNNGVRLLKTFYHRSRDEFWEQWPTIQKLCELSACRACTRLAPRSWKKVGAQFTKLVVEASLTDNWIGMKSLYNRACGTVSPNQKLWLFDVDAKTALTDKLAEMLLVDGKLLARIPSRKGEHLITIPFDGRPYWGARSEMVFGEVSLHKDNPTNLYISAEAA